MSMKVSVIVRAYNRGYIIREAIASILCQTYTNFELILVDDGSHDDTPQVVSEFQDDRVRYIRHETNRGVSAAGNTGMRAATGEVIAHLDSDDVWRPEMLSRLIRVLDEHREIGAVFCDVEIVRQD